MRIAGLAVLTALMVAGCAVPNRGRVTGLELDYRNERQLAAAVHEEEIPFDDVGVEPKIPEIIFTQTNQAKTAIEAMATSLKVGPGVIRLFTVEWEEQGGNED